MKNLLFITTTNLTTNPRLLKELKMANKEGHNCTFIGFQLGNWSDKTEKEHLKKLGNVKVLYLSATKASFIQWLLSSFIWKICSFFGKYFKTNIKLNAYAHNKRTWQIVKQLKTAQKNYDLIIAHNLGALYPTYHFSQKHNIPFAFDIEDYHPGEKCSPTEKARREFLMQKLLPKAAYVSYASPLIGKNSFKLLTEEKGKQTRLLINNSFSQDEFQLKETQSKKVQFAWFSQNIAAGRGLELVVPALAKCKDKVQLTLVGNLYNDFKHSFLEPYLGFIDIKKPLPQKELNLHLCGYDIGLAIELSTADFNRDICLTNKIFAYAQAGLYIQATDTSAQTQFIQQHPSLGEISLQSTEAMEQTIANIIGSIDKIRVDKKTRFEYAKHLAWENEGEKLLCVWKETK